MIAKMKGTYVEKPKRAIQAKREAQAAIDSLDSRRARKKAAKEASKAQLQATGSGKPAEQVICLQFSDGFS